MRGYIGVSNHGPYVGVVASRHIGRTRSRSSHGPSGGSAYNPNASTAYRAHNDSERKFNVIVMNIVLFGFLGALVLGMILTATGHGVKPAPPLPHSTTYSQTH